MKELSRLAKNVNPSTTLAIDAMAKQMRADGLDVIGFGVRWLAFRDASPSFTN